MPVIQADLKPIPSIVPADTPDMTDDQCLARLAIVVADVAAQSDADAYDPDQLDEVARLIARLAVTIE